MTLIRRFNADVQSIFSIEQYKSMTVILIGICCFLVLLKTSIPLTGMRIILFLLMVMTFTVGFFIPVTKKIFKLTSLNANSTAILVPMAFAILVLFILLSLATRKGSEKGKIDALIKNSINKYEKTKSKFKLKKASNEEKK